MNEDVFSSKWFTQPGSDRIDLGNLELSEDHPILDHTLDAVGMVQFLRLSIIGGWQRSLHQYTCWTKSFYNVLGNGYTHDYNLNLCLQEIEVLKNKHKIYLVAGHGGPIHNLAKQHVASRNHLEIPEDRRKSIRKMKMSSVSSKTQELLPLTFLFFSLFHL